MRPRTWCALLGCLSCLSCGAAPAASPTLEIAAAAPAPTAVTLPAATEPPGGTEQALLRLARAALAKRVDFGSVRRLEINRRHPNAARLKNALVAAGAPWQGDDDWFGMDFAVPESWEVHIGKEVDVAPAQAVIAACVLEGQVPFVLVRKVSDGGFGNLHRVYVGSINARAGTGAARARLAEMLRPGIAKERFHALFARDDG